MNRMSDDLISRKAVLKELRGITDEPHSIMFLMGIGAAISVIGHAETAFDKEKVIDQLKEEGCIIDDEAGNRAVEIIEKGGLN